jgi:hypothetical protein
MTKNLSTAALDIQKIMTSVFEANANVLSMKQKLNDLALCATTSILDPNLFPAASALNEKMGPFENPAPPPPATAADQNADDQAVNKILEMFDQMESMVNNPGFGAPTGYVKCLQSYREQVLHIAGLLKVKTAQLAAKGVPNPGFEAGVFYLNLIIAASRHLIMCMNIRGYIMKEQHGIETNPAA